MLNYAPINSFCLEQKGYDTINMDDGKIELSDPTAGSSTNFQDSTSLDLIIDELLKNTKT